MIANRQCPQRVEVVTVMAVLIVWLHSFHSDHGSLNTKYPRIPGTILGCPMLSISDTRDNSGMSHARETMDPGILSIPGYQDDPGMSHAMETMDP